MHTYIHVHMYVQVHMYVHRDEGSRLIHLIHQSRVFQSNQQLQRWLLSLVTLIWRILYSCLSRLELLADYHACPAVTRVLGIWIMDHACRESHSPLSHLSSSPHVDFANRTEVRELSKHCIIADLLPTDRITLHMLPNRASTCPTEDQMG